MMSNMRSGRRNSFADYKPDGHNWITLMTGEYYPDILQEACQLYEPVLVMFGQLLRTSESSVRLFIQISEVPSTWMRVQLLRVFRKYVSPEIPVEMLRRKKKQRIFAISLEFVLGQFKKFKLHT